MASDTEVVENADDTTPEVVETPDVSTDEGASEGQTFSMREFLKGHGVEDQTWESDEDAAKWTINQYVTDRRNFETEIASYKQQVAQLMQHLQRPPEPPPPAMTKEEKKAFEWSKKLPEYNRAWEHFFGPDGQLINGADPTLPIKIREYRDSLQQNISEFLNAPHEYLNPVFDHREQQLMEKLEERFKKLQEDTIRQTNKAAYYEKLGQILIDPQTQQPKPEGQAYIMAERQFDQLGEDERKRQFAQLAMHNVMLQAQMAQGGGGAVNVAEKKKELANLNRQPSRKIGKTARSEPIMEVLRKGDLARMLNEDTADLPEDAGVVW